MISNFFHTPASKKFSIRPRFYDPDKEERENREQRIRHELGMEEEKKKFSGEYRPNIKGQFRSTGGWQKSMEDGRKAQRRRLIWMFMILVLVFLIIMFADKIF